VQTNHCGVTPHKPAARIKRATRLQPTLDAVVVGQKLGMDRWRPVRAFGAAMNAMLSNIV